MIENYFQNLKNSRINDEFLIDSVQALFQNSPLHLDQENLFCVLM